MIPVEGHKNLFRNPETGAIINTDDIEYNNYMMHKEQKKRQKYEIDNLKQEIDEIKQLLKELVNESKRNNT